MLRAASSGRLKQQPFCLKSSAQEGVILRASLELQTLWSRGCAWLLLHCQVGSMGLISPRTWSLER